jgi:membrane associated rhomboid family serine protease
MFYLPPLDFRRTPFTIIVAGTAVALAVLRAMDPNADEGYYQNLVIWAPIWMGEVWRPFTTTLLHDDLSRMPLHVIFNVYVLLLFGTALEQWHGSWRIGAFVVFVGFLSSLAEFCFAPVFGDSLGRNVGLSGVVYGLFGLLWAGSRYRRDYASICQPQVVQFLIGWFLVCFLLTYLNIFAVANIAHGVGLGLGWLVGMAAFDRRRRPLWLGTAVGASLLVFATLVICPWHPLFRAVRHRGLWWVDRVFRADEAARPAVRIVPAQTPAKENADPPAEEQ